ncbi:hypothetical protein TIFTF001_003718 [Ficus carica]|uniref:Uncharacterized protein n=1 Tax=Ficus carica TaxID=3494 RepID=A0AA87ZA94_FICCA|nr:hypothetical protein TIFTF001_003718 [Ficus carica]
MLQSRLVVATKISWIGSNDNRVLLGSRRRPSGGCWARKGWVTAAMGSRGDWFGVADETWEKRITSFF